MAKEDTKTAKFDVAVIGAGPAGIMSAGKAASLGLKVVLIEKNSSLAKKLLMSGGGRCNLTNAEFNLKNLVGNYNNGEFLFHAFSVFGPERTIKFFSAQGGPASGWEGLGIKLKTENGKRVFPVSNDAEEVLEALNKYLTKNKVKILFNSEITGIDFKGNPPSPKASARRGKITKLILKSGEVVAKKYILATGGKSYASTGSDGFGYKLAEKLGHTIITPVPALSPILLKDKWVKDLQGISLKDVKISVLQNNKKYVQEEGEILFTHFGISGPTVLNISGKVENLLGKGEVKICIDLFPLLNTEELFKGMDDMLKRNANKTIKNILSAFVPERMAEVLLDTLKLDKDKIANNMSKIEREIIIKILKNIEFTAEDVLGFEQAKVTRGGISLKEIDHKTMKSKIIDNLSFAGEIIDVDGKSGGFNLQMCWSTGYIAGNSCK